MRLYNVSAERARENPEDFEHVGIEGRWGTSPAEAQGG